MALKFLPYEIEAVSPSSLLFKGIVGQHQYENDASWQFPEVNGAEPPVFNILASTPLTCLTPFSWSAREKGDENQYPTPKHWWDFILSPIAKERQLTLQQDFP